MSRKQVSKPAGRQESCNGVGSGWGVITGGRRIRGQSSVLPKIQPGKNHAASTNHPQRRKKLLGCQPSNLLCS